jgi:hypothetical protein
MATQTPWGLSDAQHNFRRGIISYETPSHGGFHVSKTLNTQVHPIWRDAKGWYEEDCAWSIVVLTFPSSFSVDKVREADGCAQRWFPEKYKVAMAYRVLGG